MRHIDCFNGDADGICALTQLRLAQPLETQLVTGVKRDIALLEHVDVSANDSLTVLDVSLDKNRQALQEILHIGAKVFYVDHHHADDIPTHPSLTILINTAAEVCTSLLINQHLGGQFSGWAVVGAFGDNLNKTAHGLAKSLSFSLSELEQLQQLGIYLNYNGYGRTVDDLLFHPAELFIRTAAFETPQAFIQNDADTFSRIAQGYRQDMRNASNVIATFERPHTAVFILPDEAWARRVSGVFGNKLANQFPDRAHAVLTENTEQGYLVSVRAPLNNRQGADKVCHQFATGGGRAAAAGINNLPSSQLTQFIDALSRHYMTKNTNK